MITISDVILHQYKQIGTIDGLKLYKCKGSEPGLGYDDDCTCPYCGSQRLDSGEFMLHNLIWDRCQCNTAVAYGIRIIGISEPSDECTMRLMMNRCADDTI